MVAVFGLAACHGPAPAPSVAGTPSVFASAGPGGTPSATPTPDSTPTPADGPTPDATPTPPPTPTPTPTAVLANEAGANSFPMGMTVSAFYAKAASLGWKCQPKSTNDPDATIDVGKTEFAFIDNGLYSITIGDRSFATGKGLRVGDTVAKMKQLYGTDFGFEEDMSEPAYIYWFADGTFLQATVDGQKITGLAIGVR